MRKKLYDWLIVFRNEYKLKLRILCLSGIILFVSGLQVNAAPQQEKLNLNTSKMTFKEIFKEIQKQTGYVVMYNNADLNKNERIEVGFNNVELSDALTRILAEKGLSFQVKEDFIILERNKAPKALQNKQEKKTIKGKVTDKGGVPLPGVSVVVKGTTMGVATDIDGNYSLDIEQESAVLIFSFVGMLSQERNYTGQLLINVELLPDTEGLEEIVVTGYQTISKERTTGSFSVISAQKMEDKLDHDILDKLEGSVAGLTTFNGSTTIRGLSTLNAESEPLYVVDGFPISSIDQVNANDIENISVLKDAAAASIWGARASNGVIVVTTKRGKQSKGTWNYRFNYKTGEKRDYSYLDRLGAKGMVDFEVESFKDKNFSWDNVQAGKLPYSKVYGVLYDLERGAINKTEADKKLDLLRNSDNASQIKDLFLARPVSQEHQLSYGIGNDSHRMFTSINYIDEKDYIKNNTETIKFTLKDDFKVNDKLHLNLGVAFNLKKWNSSNISTDWFDYKPYEQFVDKDGKPSAVSHPRKNKEEIEWLKQAGLYDETYIPLNDIEMYDHNTEDTYAKLNVGLNYKILEGLNFDVKYQLQRTNFIRKDYADENSFKMRRMINEFAQIDGNGKITYNIPQGGRYLEARGKGRDYNLRAQLNLDKTFGNHDFIALAGAERNEIAYNANQVEKFGFNPLTLKYTSLDLEKLRRGVPNTATGSPTEKYDETRENIFTDKKQRFVSFYSNFAYSYKHKYNLTASARVDQTNLFGTDKKYRYKPLWSIGTSWKISEENFFKNNLINYLQVRYTYGVNGNVANENGPYVVLWTGFNSKINKEYNSIRSPRNDKLRWEETSTQNIGVDFGLWNSRLSGSVDLYKRRSKDLLAETQLNPLVGFSVATINTGNIDNDGIEFQLNSTNIRTGNFEWRTNFNLAYNKSKVKKVNQEQDGSFFRVVKDINVEGYEANSLFSYRWAGLNDMGAPQVYNEKGEAVADEEMDDLNALVHSGTILPVYSGGLTNHLKYKNWSMSFLFIYNGGHKMRNDVASPENTNHKDIANRWKKSGDETTTHIPVYNPKFTDNKLRARFWEKSDYNILDASYLKLRYVTLSYNLPDSLIKKLNLTNVRFNLQAKNLFYWAANKEGIDPEAHHLAYGIRTLSVPKSFTLGLNVTF
jgi:TonB-linked SusC/RagA family outer membrane protein